MTSRAVALIGAALLVAGGWIAHVYGKLERQEARYEARIADMAREVSEKEKARAEAVAAAERTARERLEKDSARVASLSAELSDARAALERSKRNFDAQLQKVAMAARRDCAGLSLDWVRLYNEALGLAARSGSGPGGEDADPAGPAEAPGQAGPARAGLQPDALATPEDVLAHVRDYGGYCRRLEAQARALKKAVSP